MYLRGVGVNIYWGGGGVGKKTLLVCELYTEQSIISYNRSIMVILCVWGKGERQK